MYEALRPVEECGKVFTNEVSQGEADHITTGR